MSEAGKWIAKLQAELTQELGQPVTLTPGGEAPDGRTALTDTLELSGVRLLLAVDAAQLSALLVEARVIDSSQGDPETVRELWSGMLGSIAERIGGRLGRGDFIPELLTENCTAQLGEARLAVALGARMSGAEEQAPIDSAVMPTNSSAGEPAGRLPAAPQGNFDLLLEVELDATVRFGSREMELGQILELGPGDVVELDRHVSDPVDLIVGEKIVARGEVVLVNGNFGLRVTEVAEPMRRLESIRCLW